MINEKVECPFCEYRDKKYWLQFRLKAIEDSIRFTLSDMVGKIASKLINTEKIDWTIRDAALKEIMEDIEKWERLKELNANTK